MSLAEFFLIPVFNLLNNTLKIPINLNGGYIEIPLYLLIVFSFLIYIIDVVFHRIFDNGSE